MGEPDGAESQRRAGDNRAGDLVNCHRGVSFDGDNVAQLATHVNYSQAAFCTFCNLCYKEVVAHLFQQIATVAGSDCIKPAFMYYTKNLCNTTSDAPRRKPIEVRLVWTVRAAQVAKSYRPGVIFKRVGRTLSPFPSLCKCELCRTTQR